MKFSAQSDIFSSKISALNFDLFSTSIRPKAKTLRKRGNKLSSVEKLSALKRVLVLIALQDILSSKKKAKIQEKILGQTDFLKNRMKKDNFENLLG